MSADLLTGGLIPVEPSISQAYFELERDRVFNRSWLIVGRVSELQNPGDYLVKDVEILRKSILMVRTLENEIRAYHNICPHRGNRLAADCRGNARGFVCGFHGWTFDLQGKLAFVFGQSDFDGLDKANHGLKSVAVDTWQGFIFINVMPRPDESLSQYLAGVAHRFEGMPLDGMQRVAHYRSHVKSNWKTSMDAFQEAYHVRIVHQRSLPDLKKKWTPRVISAAGRHGNMIAYLDVAHEPTPTEKAIWKISSGFMRTADPLRIPVGLNPARQSNWAFCHFSIFPNYILIVGDGWFTTHEFWPISVDETRWEGAYYVVPSDKPLKHIASEFFKVRVRDTIREDLLAMEGVHTSQRSGELAQMILCGQEALIRHHRATLTDYVEAAR